VGVGIGTGKKNYERSAKEDGIAVKGKGTTGSPKKCCFPIYAREGGQGHKAEGTSKARHLCHRGSRKSEKKEGEN